MKLDLEGKEIEVGVIYVLPGSTNCLTVARFSHETENSYIFKAVNHVTKTWAAGRLYSWKRVLPRDSHQSLPVIRASQELIDRYELC